MRTLARILLVIALATGYGAFAQTDSHFVASAKEVHIVSLSNPTYPPLARMANISGEVELKLQLRKDGTISSLVVVSGPPMLTETALSSAQQSRFDCAGCEQELTPYTVIYSFEFVASEGWPCPERPGPHVTHTGNRITVTTEPKLVHPYFADSKTRSARCLYLWACGRQWGGEDYYFYRVRSAKCLGLWSCGRQLREPFATCYKLHRKIE